MRGMTWPFKRVRALACNCCGEAYLTVGISERVDQVMKEYRAGKLLARPIAAAGEINPREGV